RKEKELLNLNNINKKLNNSQFMNKAPQNIIEQFKNQYNDIKSSIDKLEQIINTIK
ncbi:hypothetical protein N8X83_01010, partial [Alphaproteobacteria bacterium]|nr:hypothetical protein [Alphaproteobacteria bacterium]